MKTLPERFDPARKDHELYEDVDYKGYWDGPEKRRVDESEKVLIKRLLPLRGRRIIDLGCGFGRLAPCYLGRYEKVVLFDGAVSLLRQARAAVGSEAFYVAGDIRRTPFRPGVFDSALLIRVLQHFRDVPACFREARRILEGRGRLVYSYHNKHNLRRIIRRIFFREAINPFDATTQETSPALLSHHPRFILDALRGSGFSAPDERGVGVFERLHDSRARDPLGRALAALPAGLTGTLKIAPWIIGRSSAAGGGPAPLDASLENALQCPRCGGDVRAADRGWECVSCRSRYPLIDGIHDFRIDGAGGSSGEGSAPGPGRTDIESKKAE